jgi:hypothetical protein
MLTFDLWDPGKFDIKDHPNIKKFNHFFTNKAAQQYKNQGHDILFMSDIRNLDIANENSEERMDEIIDEDNKRQLDWVQIIRPAYAFLKFRLGYAAGKSKYLNGKIYMQPYGPYSTEVRLYTKDYDTIIEYDNSEFDEKLSHFNYNVRFNTQVKYDYWANLLKQKDLRNNWDNNIGFFILKHYLEKVKNIKNDKEAVLKLFMEIYKFFDKKYGKKYDILFNKPQERKPEKSAIKLFEKK